MIFFTTEGQLWKHRGFGKKSDYAPNMIPFRHLGFGRDCSFLTWILKEIIWSMKTAT